MRRAILAAAMATLAVTSLAFELGPNPPTKPDHPVVPPPANPETVRQGGDSIDDAFVITSLPFSDTGTTVGYTDFYDQSCPYGLSETPDVNYLFTPDQDLLLTVDLCGSQYDTKTFIFGPNWEEIACNDDYYGGPPCGQYVSRIDNAPLQGGLKYLISIDGYFGSTGDYVLEVFAHTDCVLDLPPDATPEGEPPLEPGYVDQYNGGCGSSPPVMQHLVGDANGDLVFAGIAGWYDTSGSWYRDTDWFTAEIGPSGVVDIAFEAEIRSNLLELGPQDCYEVDVVNQWPAEACEVTHAQVTGEPGSVVWLWFGSQVFEPPFENDLEYFYVLDIGGLAAGTVRAEANSWSGVKALFR